MTKVTGVGCALGALMAAFLARVEPLRAAASASAIFALAGERGTRRTRSREFLRSVSRRTLTHRP
jgi:hydroxyethylthiazole kinase